MKNFKRILRVAMMALVIIQISCDDEDGDNKALVELYDYSTILEDYVDKTIVPTYSTMFINSVDMFEKAEAFAADQTQAKLDELAEAWKATRAAWEQSESFLFGPAGDFNLDPLLDSWPVDETQLTNVLNSAQELDASFVADGLGYTTRGFHTVEYLVFRDGHVRSVDEVSDREIEYLVACTEVLRNDCLTLWGSWEGGTGQSELIEELELDFGTPYGDEYKNAGSAGSRYLSQKDAADEMVQGIIGIADELGKVKMGAAHGGEGEAAPEEAESRFSYNSLTDFINNMMSIKNAYLGGYDASNRGVGLSDFVAEKDASLDAEVIATIDAAITALEACPEPFVENLKVEEVEMAMAKIAEVEEIFVDEVAGLLE